MQAFAAAVETILNDYYLLVAQMETEHRKGQLSVQRLQLFVQPLMRQFQVLANLCESIETVSEILCKTGRKFFNHTATWPIFRRVIRGGEGRGL